MAKLEKPGTDSFTAAVEQALIHFGDSLWLADHSPLAAPYFLGVYGRDLPTLRHASGTALQRALVDASQALSKEHARLAEVAFFKRDPVFKDTRVAAELNYAIATYYRHRLQTIAELAEALLGQVATPFRLERPLAGSFLGRHHEMQSCLAALRATGLVAVTGPAGVGKTAFGHAIAAHWGLDHVAWITLKPGLNDQSATFLFSLAYFLNAQGAGNAWRQIVGEQGRVIPEMVVGLLRHDLAKLQELSRPQPLICIDEIDTLHPESPEHTLLLHLIEQLRGAVSLLILGYSLLIEPTRHIIIPGLNIDDVTGLAKQQGLTLPADHLRQLTEAARGNPALIRLFLWLHHSGEPLINTLRQYANIPSLELLFNRMWRKLNDAERSLMLAISVFISSAPRDAWREEHGTLARLETYGLIEHDGAGGITPAPFLKGLFDKLIPSEAHAHMHVGAARIHEVRGDFVQAALHYVRAGQIAVAVWLWLNRLPYEFARGNAAVGWQIFGGLDSDALTDPDDQRALALLKAELLKVAGKAEDVVQTLDRATWPPNAPITARAQQLLGDAAEMQDHIAQALTHYRAGLETLAGSAYNRDVQIRARIIYLSLYRERDLDVARQEAALARLKIELLEGNIEEDAGNFVPAQDHYQRALAIAQQYPIAVADEATARSNLGRLAWKQGEVDDAIAQLQQAIALEQHTGAVWRSLHDMTNLSAAYIQGKRFEDALAIAIEGLNDAKSIQNTYLIAGLASNAGEACFYLRLLDDAERYAQLSLDQEEVVHRPYAITLMGLVQHERGQLTQADESFHQAIQAAQANEDLFAEAHAWRWLAQTHQVRATQGGFAQAHEQARDAFVQARLLFEKLGLAQEAAATVHMASRSASR